MPSESIPIVETFAAAMGTLYVVLIGVRVFRNWLGL